MIYLQLEGLAGIFRNRRSYCSVFAGGNVAPGAHTATEEFTADNTLSTVTVS